MTTETLADQIVRIRQRLTELEDERADLAPDDSRKTDLIDEERTLEARLAVLRDSATQELSGNDSGRSAEDSPDDAEDENGKASGYERVPNDDQELNDTDADQELDGTEGDQR